MKGYNDFASQHPELAIEWNYERNTYLNPDEVTSGSGKVVWWKCKECGNVWKTSIGHRTCSGYGCPKCGVKRSTEGWIKSRIAIKGSLFDNKPNIALDWDYENNSGLSPKDVTAGSGKIVAWKCHICGHRWKEIIRGRKSCPVCKGKKYTSLDHLS